MNRLTKNLLIMTLLLASFGARAAAGPHQQLSIEMLEHPTPLKANNQYYLVYEDFLTNYEKTPITLTSLDVNKQFKFAGKTLNDMMLNIASILPQGGAGYHFVFTHSEPNKPKKITIKFGSDDDSDSNNSLTLKSGESKLLLVWLPFDSVKKIPSEITQSISYRLLSDEDSSSPQFTVDTAPDKIDKIMPMIVNPPLKGEHWVAVNGASNTSKHRIAHIIVNSKLYFAQRYAIDFIQVDKNGHSYSGPEDNNKSYYCYGQDVYAVAPGKVVEVLDNLPENIPHSGKLAIPINFVTVGGNHVIVQLNKNHYAFYAHLIPGSIRVKPGDTVKTGQLLAQLGNSGNSSEPHLHFHIVDGPSFLGANGIPYGFNQFNLLKNYTASPVVTSNQLVLEDAQMNFERNKN